jgi:hypothetical protein
MMARRVCCWGLLLALPLGGMLWAQESPSFRISDQALNAGGHPSRGTTPSSTGYRTGPGSIGEPVVAGALGSASYHLHGGFVAAYPAPGEVSMLRFTSPLDLAWDPEGSTGTYNVYRSLVGGLPQDAGSCWQEGLVTPEASDADPLPPGATYFYLVTAVNRLREEGTRGRASDGSERVDSARCP